MKVGSFLALYLFQLGFDNILRARNEKVEFANSVDPDEVAHNEPPHLNLHCLILDIWILHLI